MSPYLPFYMIFVWVICITCTSTSKQNKNTLPDASKSELKYTISNISFDSKIPYFNVLDTYEDQGVTYLMLLNYSSEYFEIVDLNINKTILSKSYSNIIADNEANGEVNSIEFVNFDSIFMVRYYAIKLLDTIKEKMSIPINKSDLDAYKNCLLTNFNNSPLYYDKTNRSLSIQSYSHVIPFYDKKYYQEPIHVSFSLVDHTFYPLPIKYPEMYLKNYFGFHTLVFRSEYPDKYIVSFSADPNFYIYDKHKKLEKTHRGRSKYQLEEVKPISKKYKNDTNKKLHHLTLAPCYVVTLYDEKLKLYYRFFMNGIVEKNEDGTYNAYEDKELLLMVLDQDLKLIDEINLGKSIYNPFKSFVGDKGLYLNKFIKTDVDSIDSSKIEFDIYEFL